MQLRLRGVRRHVRARHEVLRKLACSCAFNAVGRSTAESVAYDGDDADAELVVDVLFASIDRAAAAAAVFESDYDADASVTLADKVIVRGSDRALGERVSMRDFVKDDVSPPTTARPTSEVSTPASAFTTADRVSLVYKFQRVEEDDGFTPEMMHLVSKHECEKVLQSADESDEGLRDVVIFHFLNDAARCPANFLCGFHYVHELFDALGSHPEPRLLVFAAEDAEDLEVARADGHISQRVEATRASLAQAAFPAACAQARAARRGRAHSALSALEARSGLVVAAGDADEAEAGATPFTGPIISVDSIEECGTAERVMYCGTMLFAVKVIVVASATWISKINTLSCVTHIDGHHLVVTLYTKYPHLFRLCLRYKALVSLGAVERETWPGLTCSM